MKCQRRTDTSHANASVGEKDRARALAIHREKLRFMRPSVQNQHPAPQPHLTAYGRDYYAKKKATTEAAFSDLKMIQTIAKTMTRPHELAPRKGPVSMNATSRKHELFRITMQNHHMLNSLEKLKPVISFGDLQKRAAQNQRYVVNASHSMRRSGGYDHLVQQYRKENFDAREAQLRRFKSDPAFTTVSTAAPVSAGESMAASSGSAGFSDVPRKPPPGTKLEPLEPMQTEPAAAAGPTEASSSSEPNLEFQAENDPFTAPESNEIEGASPDPTAPEPSVMSEPPVAPASPEEKQEVPPVPSDEAEVEGSPELQSETEQADAITEEIPTESEGREKEEDKPAIISEEAESREKEEDQAAIISGEAESMDHTADSPEPVEGLPSAPELPSGPEMSAGQGETSSIPCDSAPEMTQEEAPPEPVQVGLGGVTESEPKQNSDGSNGYQNDEFEDSMDLAKTEGADGNVASAQENVEDEAYNNDFDFEEESFEKDAFEQSRSDLGESQGQPSSPEGKSGALGEDYDDDFADDSGDLESP